VVVTDAPMIISRMLTDLVMYANVC
jgi:hypothetical protein